MSSWSVQSGRWSLRETEEVRHESERVKQLRKHAADRRKRYVSEKASPAVAIGAEPPMLVPGVDGRDLHAATTPYPRGASLP